MIISGHSDKNNVFHHTAKSNPSKENLFKEKSQFWSETPQIDLLSVFSHFKTFSINNFFFVILQIDQAVLIRR